MLVNYKTKFILFVIFGLALSFVPGCEKPKTVSQPPPTVTVARPISTETIDWNEFTGRLEATNVVNVRARVSGYLESIHFKEGNIVKQGDLLFVIDPRPYTAELERAQGQLATAEATQKLAGIELDRARTLLKQQAYSQETYDQRVAAELQAQGNVDAAKATVTSAQLNLEFTQIKAPINGRIGRVNVTQGNLIDGGSSQSTLLTTIMSLDPIYCYFTVDERAHLRWVRMLQEGKIPRGVKFPIWFGLADETGFPHHGSIDFVDNQLDPNTATLNIRALVPNPDLTFMPGLFVRVRVPASAIFRVLLVPDEIIESDQAQKIVYVINGEHIVAARNIKIGSLVQGFRIIKEGLSPEDNVIINGIQRVRPGQRVDPQESKIELKSKEVIPKEVRELLENHEAKSP